MWSPGPLACACAGRCHTIPFASPRTVKMFAWQADLYGIGCFLMHETT